jgi:hypothetical protein
MKDLKQFANNSNYVKYINIKSFDKAQKDSMLRAMTPAK